ncbi:MAG: hypothetical protein ACRCXD_14225 [Luteolibacter sp.]
MKSPFTLLDSSVSIHSPLPQKSQPPAPKSASRPASHRAADVPVIINGHEYLCIPQIDRLPAFLLSVVSDSDFWLFVGSNGGFTAGRIDPDHAVFPYQTADRILDQPNASGVLTQLLCDDVFWEPWNGRCPSAGITRHLYKHVCGTSVLFEEIHQALGLRLRWELTASERFGLVRTCRLENIGDRARTLKMLDGWHHLLPAGVTQETYARYSYLAAAYMRHEACTESGLGIYTLNSGITDRAEPCESLRVACAWSIGLDEATLLLSDHQVDAFRRQTAVRPETEARGVFGAHLLATPIHLEPSACQEWIVVADTRLDHSEVSRLRGRLLAPADLRAEVTADLAAGVLALKRRIAGAGAIQQSAESGTSVHHFANVLFNCMRGGTLHDHYRFPSSDFGAFLKCRNLDVLRRHQDWVSSLPENCSLQELSSLAAAQGDPPLSRLAGEYLPICFSRRHGDPSRPWNRFEIHTKDAEGRPLFAYAGNWRDIFQNWESLAYSYPLCFGSMISIFLNASTADGYNPYRITRSGVDWEVFDASDPWSHIGYWGDHQIIYLLRLLEGQERFSPGLLTTRLNDRCHTYASVPYEIGGFDELVKDPKHSIRFNETLHQQLAARAGLIGGDGKLLASADGEIIHVSLAEKLLVPLLVKLSNLVPGGGIWLNTQRPEWNDANNALAGWGLSVVTVCYMRRYLAFLDTLFDARAVAEFELSEPVAELLASLSGILPQAAAAGMDDSARFRVTEALGRAGEKHRSAVYQRRALEFTSVGITSVREFITTALAAVDATLVTNRRDEHLFHSYNLLELGDGKAAVRHLDLMLEGQVAALSSGILKPAEALGLMVALRESPLYREDQNSYLLYPDRVITPFAERNTLPVEWKTRIPQLAESIIAGSRDLIRIDGGGRAHFHPDLTNARDLDARLDRIASEAGRKDAVRADRAGVLELWEEVFHHRSFTGRSGAMFAFEGLGSIYWHMVAKLLLALQEIHTAAVRDMPNAAETLLLAGIYDNIRNGLGFTKDSKTYGAFPTDPYSHSPRHRGAQQPGMTGQVKEEILTRMGELGVHIDGGCVRFHPVLLKPSEFFTVPHAFEFIDLQGGVQTWKLGAGTLAFTAFQVPVCYVLGEHAAIQLAFSDGRSLAIEGNLLPLEHSRSLFERGGTVQSITVTIPESQL